jgi:catechol 2,3-dioxygenase-like lactoylglutathione lyase family enzyme
MDAMKIMRIESLVYGVEDLEAGKRYLDDWGVASVDRGQKGTDYVLPSGQTIALRDAADRSLPEPVEAGSTLREIVWGVDDAASLDALGAELGKDQKVARGSDGILRGRDPWGLSIGFAVAKPNGAASANGRKRNHPFDIPERATPTRVGHAVFFVPASKIKATADFYADRLGFRFSDRVPGFGDFLRCAGSVDHHNLFILQTGERAGFNHAAFEVSNFDEIIVGGKHMEGCGWKAATRPGRHIMGSNLFWYFESPCGGNTEYYADMDVMDDDWKARVWEKHPGFAYWMMEEAKSAGAIAPPAGTRR